MLDPVGGMQLTNKRHRLRVYPDCFHGYELVMWLVDSDKAHDQPQAIIIGQALLDARHVVCLADSNKTFFNDYTLYQFRRLNKAEMQNGQLDGRRLSVYPEAEEEGPVWVQELDRSNSTGLSLFYQRLSSVVNV